MRKVLLGVALAAVLIQTPAEAGVLSAARSVVNTVKTTVTRGVTNLVNAGKTVLVGTVNVAKDTASALVK